MEDAVEAVLGAVAIAVYVAPGAAVADIPARIEDRRGDPVIVTDTPMEPLTVDDVRAAIQRVRR